MSKKRGSYVYILKKDGSVKEKRHGETLNEAKFQGLEFFYEAEEPFYRFTKIPFPYLFYASSSYLVYVVYVRLAGEDIPYVRELSPYDKEMKENMALFTEAFGLEFYLDPDARAKRRDPNRRKKKKTRRRNKTRPNLRKHYESQ